MAYPDRQYLQVISQIAESLDSSERRRVCYLCESPDADDSVICVKETLKSKVMCHESGSLFLQELLLELKRFDILRKVCGLSREEVARSHEGRQVFPKFRVLMDHLSEDMASEDLSSVKFLMSRTVPGEKMKKAKTFLDLAVELEKQDLVSPERVDLLEECLKNAGRVDLARKVAAYKTSVSSPGCSSAQQERCRAPFPLPTPTISPLRRQTRQEQLFHNVTRNPPPPVLRGPCCQSQPDQYSFSSNPRGVCVIIDCVGKDGDMLEQTFRTLRFNVILHKWLDAGDIVSALRDISKQRDTLKGDGLVCCIISRASEEHLLGVDCHSSGPHLHQIRHLFTAGACPLLAGKPKLFFFKTYSVAFQSGIREYRDEDLQTDGCNGPLRYECIPTDADVFWSHCWTDEYQLQDERHCSVYLKALADSLLKGQKRKTKFLDVHTEVNRAVFEHNARNPAGNYQIDLKHTLRKDLYF